MVVDQRARSTDKFLVAVRTRADSGEGVGPVSVEVGDVRYECDGPLAETVLQVIAMYEAGQRIEVSAVPELMTTGQVADLLGVSRPTIVKLIESGKLPATKVRTHRRIRASDAFEYRQRAAESTLHHLDEMSVMSAELGLYD